MDYEVRYEVRYVLVGFNESEVTGQHAYVDEISDLELSLAGGNVDDLVMAGMELDEMLAESILRDYIEGVIGIKCVEPQSIFDHIVRDDDGIYLFGSLSVSLDDPTSKVTEVAV